MTDLPGAVLDLRVQVLAETARLRGYQVDKVTLRELVRQHSDSEIFEQLRQQHNDRNWLVRWLSVPWWRRA